MTTFFTSKKVNLNTRYEVLQNLTCDNCGSPWKDHQAVPNSKTGAGTCPK